MKQIMLVILVIALLGIFKQTIAQDQTVALWLFDEPQGLYPSHVLDDASDNDYPMVLGPGGTVVAGKYGNALSPQPQPEIRVPQGDVEFGLSPAPKANDRKIEPMNWMNARFCALMTSGEKHLRKEVGFTRVTRTKLNLGNFDWTVEFWFKPSELKTDNEGCVFEIGQGPRGENNYVTRLTLSTERDRFVFFNQPANATIDLVTVKNLLNDNNVAWHHIAFTYSSLEKTVRHYFDGQLLDSESNFELQALAFGEEDYMSIGRNGLWEMPLQGDIDELRFSSGIVYTRDFTPPQTFSPVLQGKYAEIDLKKGLPLLFGEETAQTNVIKLMDRKHLFIDDTLLAKVGDVKFTVNPPRKAERVIDNIDGPFRKHLTVVEDDKGVIRIYNSIHDDFLAVRTSTDGINFEVPDMGSNYRGQKNIVIQEMVGGLGNPFIDPNGPPERRWKYISGYHRRGIYVYTSPDGYTWTRHKTAHLPFRSGTQSCTFYDDQRQLYVGYHRTGIFRTPAGATQRGSVFTESKNLYEPLKYQTLSQEDYLAAAKKLPLREPLPWYLDNGPLTPGGFGLEFPSRFNPIAEDPVGTDIYITKAQKYPWAPDTYLAFPIVYFHYELDGPATRQVLMDPQRGRGSGPVETQLSVSRDGLNWQRFPRPTYVGIGTHQDRDVYTAYIADGMVRRGDEIWQYYFGEAQYHSAYKQNKAGRAVYRLVQRLDGFVSIDSPYNKEVEITTKPLIFKGNRLVLNIDTDAAGYAQVGFLDENGKPIDGFSVDDCVYINGDFIETDVEWFQNWRDFSEYDGKRLEEIEKVSDKFMFTKDVSPLEGKVVQIVFRMRGSKLYAMQFINK